MICDASIPTFMLTHWARDRAAATRCRSSTWCGSRRRDTAALFGLGDRGVLAPGKKADVNVIDFDAPDAAHARAWPTTCPPAAAVSCRSADGYVATMVSGEVTRRHGVDTGARPGRLVRGAR